ncbi:MAG TPA: hypothetical protein VFW44_22830 [Bryobacteraceae bacterium]|nr:hypothetical protein [Bryobacteraceae bacterium]
MAPPSADTSPFRNVGVDAGRHRELLAEAQVLRANTYLNLGALDPAQLSSGGRHIHPADDRSWHLLTLDGPGRVAACLRYQEHRGNVPFQDLTIASTSLATSDRWATSLRSAVEGELAEARRRGASYVEMGGWAITEALRCTTEALRMIVTTYGMAELSGGALGITTATLRSCSAAILRRVGGERLSDRGVPLPPYFEHGYKSIEAEILRFDSSAPNPRYRKWLNECRAQLIDMPVICRESARRLFMAPAVLNFGYVTEPLGGLA